MNIEKRLTIVTENMEIISDRLGELSNLINIVYLGLMRELTEKQVLDCVACFPYSVDEIHEIAEKALKEICEKGGGAFPAKIVS